MKLRLLVEQLKREPLLFPVLGGFVVVSAVLAGVVYAFPGGLAHYLRALTAIFWLGYASTFGLSTYVALAVVSLLPSLLLLTVACLATGAWLALGMELLLYGLLVPAGASLAGYIETRFAPRKQALDLLEEFERERKNMGEMFGSFVQISSASELSKVLDGTVKVLANTFGVTRAVIFTADMAARQLKPMRTVGYRLDSPDAACVKVIEPHWKFPDFDPYNLNQAARQRINELQRTVAGAIRDLVLFVPIVGDGRMTGGLASRARLN